MAAAAAVECVRRYLVFNLRFCCLNFVPFPLRIRGSDEWLDGTERGTRLRPTGRPTSRPTKRASERTSEQASGWPAGRWSSEPTREQPQISHEKAQSPQIYSFPACSASRDAVNDFFRDDESDREAGCKRRPVSLASSPSRPYSFTHSFSHSFRSNLLNFEDLALAARSRLQRVNHRRSVDLHLFFHACPHAYIHTYTHQTHGCIFLPSSIFSSLHSIRSHIH